MYSNLYLPANAVPPQGMGYGSSTPLFMQNAGPSYGQASMSMPSIGANYGQASIFAPQTTNNMFMSQPNTGAGWGAPSMGGWGSPSMGGTNIINNVVGMPMQQQPMGYGYADNSMQGFTQLLMGFMQMITSMFAGNMQNNQNFPKKQANKKKSGPQVVNVINNGNVKKPAAKKPAAKKQVAKKPAANRPNNITNIVNNVVVGNNGKVKAIITQNGKPKSISNKIHVTA